MKKPHKNPLLITVYLKKKPHKNPLLITVYLKNRVRYIHFHEEAPQED
jgi:hypothetical protein